jgi:hypothetical protein
VKLIVEVDDATDRGKLEEILAALATFRPWVHQAVIIVASYDPATAVPPA